MIGENPVLKGKNSLEKSVLFDERENKWKEMKMNKPLHITDNEFQNKVLDASIPVVVDFWAPWCGPCKFIAPILDKIAADFDDKVLIAKVNTDENPEWATKLGVQGIPTLLFVSQGDIKSRLVGAAPAQQIIAKINELLPVTTG